MKPAEPRPPPAEVRCSKKWIRPQERSIFERTGLTFGGIDDDETGIIGSDRRTYAPPLSSSRKPGSAAAPNASLVDQVDRGIRAKLSRPIQSTQPTDGCERVERIDCRLR